MRALRESIFILRSNDGSLSLSDTSHAPVEIAGRLSDANEPREHHDATSGGKERMTGAEHEAIMPYPAQHGQVARLDDAPALDRVAEARVGQAERHRVATAQGVEVAERRAVGRAMAGDRGRAALAGQRRSADKARAA